MAALVTSLLAFALVALLALLLQLVWFRLFDRRSQALRQRLEAIGSELQGGSRKDGEARPGAGLGSSIEVQLRRYLPVYTRLEALVRRAHSPVPPLRLALSMLALFLGTLLIGSLGHAGLFSQLLIASGLAALPPLWLLRQAGKRRKAFEEKLPEVLDYISRALHAGHSLTSAIGMIGKEFPDPIGEEFKTVFDEIAFGIPFKNAMRELADRVGSPDLDFFVISILIQHETGGNLTELLDGLSGTIRERVKLRGKVRTLSSEGRASAMVLGGMPFALAGILSLLNFDYISLLWTTPQGHTLLLIGAGLMAFGFLLLNRIVQIRV